MKLNKSKIFLFLPLFLALFVATPLSAFADEPEISEFEVSKEKIARITQYCETIKSNFKRLAVSDSKTRTYYGGIYETVSSKYITPLNLRLIKNNYSLSDFIELQSSFISARSKFSSDFIDYSKSLEELSVFDCKNNPSEFYEKLNQTREKRAVLRTDIETLNSLFKTHVSLVKDLKGSLND
ncbi:hypothetical protein IJG21_02635 [Candidatus Saccharibacteria bacterium]|nr:hypothetical protein [Candidatus Saccharibacteria bacterium]